ncbi:MAG: YceI family protein [Candidatus Acidiferrum sp.]
MRLAVLCLLVYAMLPSVSRAQNPVFTVSAEESDIKFFVKASVAIDGKFKKWESTLTFSSPDVTTGVLDIKIYADSVDTGSDMKDGKLKSKDFFNAKDDPYITFHSTKVVQTSPTTFDVQGTFTIRGVSKPETLSLTVDPKSKGTGNGHVKGTMAFDRKEFGMNSGIPFIKIADRVEVDVALQAHQLSGPKLVFKE